jgi:hypothetical protein
MNIAFVIPSIDVQTARTLQLQAELLRGWGADLQIFTAAVPTDLPLSLQVAVRQVAPGANLATDGFFRDAELTVYCYTQSHPLLSHLRGQSRGVALLYSMAAVTTGTRTEDQGLEQLLPYADLVVVGSQIQSAQLHESGYAAGRIGVLGPVNLGPAAGSGSLAAAAVQGKPVIALLALPDDPQAEAMIEALQAQLPGVEVVCALPMEDLLARAVLVVALAPGPDVALDVMAAMAAGRPVLGLGAGYWDDAVQQAGVVVASVEEGARLAAALLDDHPAGAGRYSSLAAAGRSYAAAHPLQEWALAWHGLLAQAAGWLPLTGRARGENDLYQNRRSRVQGDVPVEAQAVAPLARELAHLRAAAAVLPESYEVRSPTPVVGPVIAWVRRQLTSHLREPYLEPILQKQEHFNWQAVVALEELAREAEMLQAQRAAQQEELARRNRELAGEIAQLLVWIEVLQQQPDPATWQALREKLLALQQEFQLSYTQEEGP